MKKLVSILLTAVLILGLAMTTFAANDDGALVPIDPPKNPNSSAPVIYNITDQVYAAGVYGDYMGDAAWFPENTAAGSIIQIPLLKRGFRDELGGEVEGWDLKNPTWGPTVQQLKLNRVTAEIHVLKGKEYVKSIEIVPMTPTDRNPAQAMVQITFVDKYVSTAEFDYEFSVYLSLGRKKTATSEVFGGRLSNDIYDVYQIDYLYIGDGQVAYAQTGTQMGLKLGLGNGVNLHRDMFITEKYYGFATLYGNEHQDPITQAYRKYIDTVIDITSVDMKVNGAYITLDKELSQPSFYVYDLAGQYVGRSGDKLPYSTRYYLAIEEIDIDPALSQHPIAQGDDAKLGNAVTRFLEGGRAAANLAIIEEN